MIFPRTRIIREFILDNLDGYQYSLYISLFLKLYDSFFLLPSS